MNHSPTCIDALECRLATNVTWGVTYRNLRSLFQVEAKGFSEVGTGHTLRNAVHNFLVRNHLETAEG
jgi:N6-adenosine-specific RNA methylase IME4